jgi:hypothetical protein
MDKTAAMTSRIFLLSPANLAGKRAQILSRGDFPLARALRSAQGAPLGDVFSFLSGLYFRGKLAYARAFARSASAEPANRQSVYVITAGAGLMSPDDLITGRQLRTFARVEVDEANLRYRQPLVRDAERLAASSDTSGVILLGSIATAKYIGVLLEVFGERLFFPTAFIGRGDLSRGGLLLRCANEGAELAYVPAGAAERHGPRPAKLRPRPRLQPHSV